MAPILQSLNTQGKQALSMAAGGEVKKKRSHHRRHGDTLASKSHKRSSENDRTTTTKSSATATDRPADIEALRKARLEHLAKSPEEKQRKDMKYEYVKSTKTVSHVGGVDKEKRYRLVRDPSPEGERSNKPSRTSIRRTTDANRPRRDNSEDEYVYGKSERDTVRKEVHSRSAAKPQSKTNGSVTAKTGERRRMPERRHTEPARRRELHEDDEEEARPDTARVYRTAARRESDAQDLPKLNRRSTVSVEKQQRSPLKRSVTTTTTKPKTEVGSIRTAQTVDPHRKAPGIFGGLLLPNQEPQKKVPCLTCGADDVPISKSARLPCTHRMCHSCLKRIFTMSVKDPAHMPPRCCTDQDIDLKHVEKLFDQKFKKLWNRRYAEFKTKNRIYCPARRCGAWIKPHYIKVEDGRKVGRCKHCKTRVCGVCSQKMHVSRDCPKDPETKAFVEVAKEKGWQRCYSCSAMVELKEGCNHMTCRCTAEFCMVCGLKWKSCDCPWFNYQTVDAHLGDDPVRYQEEIDRRRDQVDRDEELARRMQQMGLGLGDDAGRRFDGFGQANPNGNDHMNQNFIQQAREALTANYAQAGQAARDLINGLVMGRENRTPGMPLQMEQMLEMLGQHGASPLDPAEEDQGHQDAGRRPTRRVTARRRNVVQDAAGGHRVARETDEERRIRDWANSVPA
ncbi:hypothetical protein LTS15_006186 [Exophiala xenobiotica]|nr:hypothetical protein LTS15_006186 [Exophiala xenobiotica]